MTRLIKVTHVSYRRHVNIMPASDWLLWICEVWDVLSRYVVWMRNYLEDFSCRRGLLVLLCRFGFVVLLQNSTVIKIFDWLVIIR